MKNHAAKKLLEQFPLFLFLLPAFIVLHLETEFTLAVKYDLIFGRIIALFLIPVFCWLLFFLLTRSRAKASLMAFCCMMVLFFTGDLKNALHQSMPDSFWQSYTFLIPVLFILLTLILLIIKRKATSYKKTFLFLNLVLLLFLAYDGFRMLFINEPVSYKLAPATEVEVHADDTITGPDIYYLILDAYTSTGVLQSDFNYSNALMESDLRSKGFITIPTSKSNYNYTVYSIGSALNLNYLDYADTVHGITDRTYLKQLGFVYQTKFISFLEKKNYRIFNHSIFDFKSAPSTTRDLDFWGLRVLYDQYNLPLKFINESGYHFPKAIRDISGNDKYSMHKPGPKNHFTETVFNQVLAAARDNSSQPKFVYGHFLTTHTPYYYDSLGRDFPRENMPIAETYIHRVAYTNTLVKRMTDSILFYARRPTAIIICGDHGVTFNHAPGSRNQFSNFFAAYFSNKDYSLFSDSMHSVNTFRILMNAYFKKDYPLLPYQSYPIK